MTHEFSLELGDVVTDDVTGFEGTVTGLVTYLHGNDTACVKPKQLKDGRPQSSEWLDIGQLTKVTPMAEAEKETFREKLK